MVMVMVMERLFEVVSTVPIYWDVKSLNWYGWDTVYYDRLVEFGYRKYLITYFPWRVPNIPVGGVEYKWLYEIS